MPVHEGQHTHNCVPCRAWRVQQLRMRNPVAAFLFRDERPDPDDDEFAKVTNDGHDVVQGEVLGTREGWK